jgi:leader peptidase (prepilin peptidase)/N-methyltransferase
VVEIAEETLTQLWAIRAMAAFTVSWFFCVGACVGSFVNVLVWRWPRGRSPIREPSACPACQTRIRWDDNMPLLGWLRLRGRCRSCQAPISARYPLVEALVGVQFVGLLCAEALTGGGTIPLRPIDPYAGVVWIIWYAKQPDLLRLYAWHLGLLLVATVVWLIDEDRQRVPRSLFAGAVAIGFVGLAAFPDLHPLLNLQVGYRQPFEWLHRVQAVLSGGLGLLAGCGVGALLTGFVRPNGFRPETWPVIGLMGVCGLALGWQPAVSVALLATLVALLRAGAGAVLQTGWAPSPVFDVWLAVHVQLLAWRWLDQQQWWPGSRAPWFAMGLALPEPVPH